MQSSSQIITTNKPTSSFFYRPDALPVTQPTVSKHWRGKYRIPWTCLPQAHLGIVVSEMTYTVSSGTLNSTIPYLPTLSLTTNSFWLPCWSVAMPLISPLMPVPQRHWLPGGKKDFSQLCCLRTSLVLWCLSAAVVAGPVYTLCVAWPTAVHGRLGRHGDEHSHTEATSRQGKVQKYQVSVAAAVSNSSCSSYLHHRGYGFISVCLSVCLSAGLYKSN